MKKRILWKCDMEKRQPGIYGKKFINEFVDCIIDMYQNSSEIM